MREAITKNRAIEVRRLHVADGMRHDVEHFLRAHELEALRRVVAHQGHAVDVGYLVRIAARGRTVRVAK